MTRVPRQVLVYLLRRDENGRVEVLLLRRTPEHGGFWQGVTGAPEAGEDDREAAAREVREETGLAVDDRLRPVGFRYELRPPGDDPAAWESLYGPGVEAVPEEVFAAEVPRDWEPELAPLEHDAARWCPIDQALELLVWEENRQALVAAHRRAMTETRLPGGGSTRVARRGPVVLREARPSTRTVHALLRHLEREGFTGAPRVVGGGFDADGRETISFVEGETPHPHAWTDDGAAAVGALVRELHRASATFEPPADAVWLPWFGRDLGGSRRIVGHCDAAPWNILAVDGLPVVLVDWDVAGPVDPRIDLAYAAWLNAQLHDDDIAELNGLPDLATRARQLGLIVDAYELPKRDRAGFVEVMVEVAVASAAREAVDAGLTRHGTTPGGTSLLGGGAPLQGQDLLWAIAWRTRGAAWMLRHRRALGRALR